MMKTRFAIAFFLLMALALTGCGKKPSAGDNYDEEQPFHCFSDEFRANFLDVQPEYDGPDAVFFMISIEEDSTSEPDVYYGNMKVEQDTAFYIVFDSVRYDLRLNEYGEYDADHTLGPRHVNIMGFPNSEEE